MDKERSLHMGNQPIISSQFVPPTNRTHDIDRSTLNKKLQLIPTVPLTLVHAEVGYGKSTALASFVSGFQGHICWYTLSENDNSMIEFLRKLTYAINRKYPSFERHFVDELSVQKNILELDDIKKNISIFINNIL